MEILTRENINRTIALALAAAIIASSSSALFAASKKKEPQAIPPYRASGPIPGTSLLSDRLFITEGGTVSVSIRNPERSGVRFRAAFSFYSAKNDFLTGFIIEGTATASTTASYSLKLPDHQKLKNVSYMTVLGRSGRSSGDDWE